MSNIDSIWKKEGEEWKKMSVPSPDIQTMYDLIHPVNEVVFGYEPTVPTGITATWELQTTHSGRFIKLASTKAEVGTTVAQEMPKHHHTLGSGVALIGMGWDATYNNKLGFKSAGYIHNWLTTEESSFYTMPGVPGWGNTTSGRMGGCHATKLAGNADETNTINSGKVQPDGIVLGEWKRIA